MAPRTALTRLIVVNASAGAALGVGLAVGVLGANSAAMAHLIVADEAAVAAFTLMLASFAALGSTALTSSAIMGLGDAGHSTPTGGGDRVPVRAAQRGR